MDKQKCLGERKIEKDDRFDFGHDENKQWLEIKRTTSADFFPEYTLEINDVKVSWS